jgi:hypothetical protein
MTTTTTTSSKACIFKSVTLAVGEKFTLPPGSTLLGATGGSSSITSTCPVPTLENVQCYIFSIPFDNYDNRPLIGSGSSEPWRNGASDAPRIAGYKLGTIEKNLTRGYSPSDSGQITDNVRLIADLKLLLPITNALFGSYSNGGRGYANFILIQTIPSIAQNLSLIVSVNQYGAGTPRTNAYFEAEPYNDWAGKSGVPVCTLPTNSNTGIIP